MAFCKECRDRPAVCLRRCERVANGERLWWIIQDELMRDRPNIDTANLTWERQAADVRRAFVVGAQAIRDMPR